MAPALLPLLAAAGEKVLYLAVLDPNGLASELVPGHPQFLLTGVTAQGIIKVSGIPRRLRWWRALGMGEAVMGMATGAALLSLGYCWLALSITLLSTLALRSFAGIPGNAFEGQLVST